MKTFKKIPLLFLFLILPLSILAQVGIGTTNPQAELHIANPTGTIRLNSFNSSNNTNNNGTDPAVVMTNANGDLFLSNRVNKLAIDAKHTSAAPDNFLTTAVIVKKADGTVQYKSAYNKTITLTRETLTLISFTIGTVITDFNDNAIIDGQPRMYGAYIYVQETSAPTGMYTCYETRAYTSSDAANTIIAGPFMLNSSSVLKLPAGTYTFTVVCFAEGGFGTGSGYKVEFGTAATVNNSFQVVYLN